MPPAIPMLASLLTLFSACRSLPEGPSPRAEEILEAAAASCREIPDGRVFEYARSSDERDRDSGEWIRVESETTWFANDGRWRNDEMTLSSEDGVITETILFDGEWAWADRTRRGARGITRGTLAQSGRRRFAKGVPSELPRSLREMRVLDHGARIYDGQACWFVTGRPAEPVSYHGEVFDVLSTVYVDRETERFVGLEVEADLYDAIRVSSTMHLVDEDDELLSFVPPDDLPIRPWHKRFF